MIATLDLTERTLRAAGIQIAEPLDAREQEQLDEILFTAYALGFVDARMTETIGGDR